MGTTVVVVIMIGTEEGGATVRLRSAAVPTRIAMKITLDTATAEAGEAPEAMANTGTTCTQITTEKDTTDADANHPAVVATPHAATAARSGNSCMTNSNKIPAM